MAGHGMAGLGNGAVTHPFEVNWRRALLDEVEAQGMDRQEVTALIKELARASERLEATNQTVSELKGDFRRTADAVQDLKEEWAEIKGQLRSFTRDHAKVEELEDKFRAIELRLRDVEQDQETGRTKIGARTKVVVAAIMFGGGVVGSILTWIMST